MTFSLIKYSFRKNKKKASSLSLRRLLRKYSYVWIGMLLLFTGFYYSLPKELFKDPVSTVLLDGQGELIGARIARDGQWRFPAMDTVPLIFAETIINFEDKRFYQHPGVDPLAMGRAVWLNLSRGEVVSGGSTLSMQVIRLSRKGKGRTIWEKLVEIVLATRLEFAYSKEEILALYASYAPFGGNVVGLDAAAWKYYGRAPHTLSWAESATLAVLPNAPSLIHPGKNRDLLRIKRDFLLQKLLESGNIDSLTFELALEENLPDRPRPLPSFAPHLLEEIHQKRLAETHSNKSRIQSTLQLDWQRRGNELAERYYNLYKPPGINNLAILVAEVSTGDVKVYVGNTPGQDPSHNCAVNIIPSPRSTGSIMKPFLYASMLSEGELLPHMLIPDIPTRYGGYYPKNFDRSYQGAVPASQALARSLNIPAVRMLSNYGIGRFRDKVQSIGLNSINRSAENYGLTLILGGAESSLWELTGAYAGMARTLNNYIDYNGKYEKDAFRPLNYYQAKSQTTLTPDRFDELSATSPFSASSIWQTFQAMIEVSRPYGESYWENYSSSGKIAWKTGTSYGFRDAWAIGCTPEYVIGVWVGNADGEGRPELIGSAVAAPILFDMFDVVGEGSTWFTPPHDDMIEVEVCAESGHLITDLCTNHRKEWIGRSAQHTKPCPYHQWVYLDKEGKHQVHSDCESPLNMTKKALFILPPIQEIYYRGRHPDYEVQPSFRTDCLAKMSKERQSRAMEMIYPLSHAKIYIPVDLDGKMSETVFEAAHRNQDITLFWHLDGSFIGQTKNFHEMALRPSKGKHSLTLVDEKGEHLTVTFEILTERKDESSG